MFSIILSVLIELKVYSRSQAVKHMLNKR